MKIRPFREADEPYVIDLWQACDLTRPWNDPQKDIARKLTVQRDLFLVCEIDGGIVATVMAGYDGHRGWVNYLAVHPGFRRRSSSASASASFPTILRPEPSFTGNDCYMSAPGFT